MTDYYTLDKSVEVELESRGVPTTGTVGLNPDGTIFGYAWQGSLTHMPYRLDEHFVPAEVVARTRERDGLFYLDAGNKFTISADELERAFRELGLL